MEGLVSLHKAGRQRPDVEEDINTEAYGIIILDWMASDQLNPSRRGPQLASWRAHHFVRFQWHAYEFSTSPINRPDDDHSDMAITVQGVPWRSYYQHHHLNTRSKLGWLEGEICGRDHVKIDKASATGWLRTEPASSDTPHQTNCTKQESAPGLETTTHSTLSTRVAYVRTSPVAKQLCVATARAAGHSPAKRE